MRCHLAEDDAAHRPLNNRQPLGDRFPEAGGVIEMMVADDQLRDGLAWHQHARMIDDGFRLRARIHTKLEQRHVILEFDHRRPIADAPDAFPDRL